MVRVFKKNIYEQLNANAIVQQPVIKSVVEQPIVIEQPVVKEVTLVVEPSKLDKAITRETAKRAQYYTILNRFLSERCEYVPGVLLDYELVREAYYQFVRDHHSEFNSIDCNFKFAPKDVIELDPRYEYKRLYYCRSCTHRHYHKCCDEYQLGKRFTRYGVIGLNLKKIDSDSNQNNIQDESTTRANLL